VRRLEESHAQRSPVTFETVAQRGEAAIGVHPLAKVGENLLTGLRAVQRFQLGPFLRLCLADETEHHLRENGSLAVEAIFVHRNKPMTKQVLLDGDFKGNFGDTGWHGNRITWFGHHEDGPKMKRARSIRSISKGETHLMLRPMQTLGTFIFLGDGWAFSWVTTVCPCASAWATR
jgi:hypothetical protein